MISVIIPVHNTEQYLERCVNSVLDSTYKDLEIILVENGSTDNSITICRKYEEQFSNIKVLVADRAGVSHARNLGLEIASGEYITFIDSDDYISPYMYESLIKCAIDNDSDLTFCDSIMGNDSAYTFDQPKETAAKAESIDSYYYSLFIKENRDYISVWNTLYKKSLFADIRFNESYAFAEDMLFSAQIVTCSKKTVHLLTSLYYYWRGNTESICNYAKDIEYTYIRMQAIYSKLDVLQFVSDVLPDSPALKEYLSCSILRNADFRMKKAKEFHLSDQQAVLSPIIKESLSQVKHAKYLPKKEKYQYLTEHYWPSLIPFLYKILKSNKSK